MKKYRYLSANVPTGDTRKMASAPRGTVAGNKQFFHGGKCWFAARYFERFGHYGPDERQFRAEYHRFDRPAITIRRAQA